MAKMTNQQFRDLVKSGLEVLDSDDLCDQGKEIIGKLRQDLGMTPIMDLNDLSISFYTSYFTIDSDFTEEFVDCHSTEDVSSKLEKLGTRIVLLDKDDCIVAQADDFSLDEVIDNNW